MQREAGCFLRLRLHLCARPQGVRLRPGLKALGWGGRVETESLAEPRPPFPLRVPACLGRGEQGVPNILPLTNISFYPDTNLTQLPPSLRTQRELLGCPLGVTLGFGHPPFCTPLGKEPSPVPPTPHPGSQYPQASTNHSVMPRGRQTRDSNPSAKVQNSLYPDPAPGRGALPFCPEKWGCFAPDPLLSLGGSPGCVNTFGAVTLSCQK